MCPGVVECLFARFFNKVIEKRIPIPTNRYQEAGISPLSYIFFITTSLDAKIPGLENCRKTGRHIDAHPNIFPVTVANSRKLQSTGLENTNNITTMVALQRFYKLCCIFSTSFSFIT